MNFFFFGIIISPRHHGLVVRAPRLWCGRSPDRNHLRSSEQRTLSVHPAANGYPTRFRAGEGLGGKGRVDGHHSFFFTLAPKYLAKLLFH